MEKITITVGVKKIEVSARYSNKTTRTKIKVSHTGEVELVVPERTSLTKAKEFLLTNLAWVTHKIEAIKNVKAPRNQIPIFGELHKIEHTESYNQLFVRSGAGKIFVSCPGSMQKQMITEYLKDLFFSEIKRLVREISKEHRFHVNKIQIKDHKSKWGSCSSKQNLSFNWKLVFAPHHVIRYLVVHELCHLKEMNHSKKFWNLVGRIDPNYSASRSWLRKNSVLLHSYL